MAKNERGWLERQARDRTECDGCLFKDAGCIECDRMALRWAWYYFCLEMPIFEEVGPSAAALLAEGGFQCLRKRL